MNPKSNVKHVCILLNFVFLQNRGKRIERVIKCYAFFPVATEPPVQQEGQAILLYDLASVIGCVYQQSIEPTKEDKLPKRLLTKIRPLLQCMPRIENMQEDILADQLFHTARGMDLLCVSTEGGEEKARYGPGPRLEGTWSQLTLVGQARRFLTYWAQKSSWCDVTVDGKLIYPSSYSAARTSVLSLLAECIEGGWYRIDALLFALWKRQPLYLYESYQSQPQKISLRERRTQWMSREGLVYRALLFSTLYELGIVSLGWTARPSIDEAISPDLFLVTPFGAMSLISLLTPLNLL